MILTTSDNTILLNSSVSTFGAKWPFWRIAFPITTFLLVSIFNLYSQSLEELQQEALKNNPSLKGAYADFEGTLQRVPQASSLEDPQLTMSAFGRMIETRVGRQEARFTLSQMFPWFGTLKLQKNSAEFLAEAQFNDYLDQRAVLLLGLSTTYFDLSASEKRIKLEQENLELYQNLKELSLAKYKAGTISMVDVIKIDLMINESESNIGILKTEQKPLYAQLALLLGRQDGQTIHIVNDEDYGFELDAPNIYDFEMHPSIKSIDHQIAGAQTNIELARKNSMPNLEVGLDYSIIARRQDEHPVGNGRNALMPMVGLSLPIYRKKYIALEKESEYMLEGITHSKDQQRNELMAEYQNTLAEIENAKLQSQLYTRQISTISEAIGLLQVQYSNAQSEIEEEIMLRQELIRFKKEQLNAWKLHQQAWVKIEYLTNKGIEK